MSFGGGGGEAAVLLLFFSFLIYWILLKTEMLFDLLLLFAGSKPSPHKLMGLWSKGGRVRGQGFRAGGVISVGPG